MRKYSLIGLIIICIIVSTSFINYLIYNNYYNEKIIDVVNQIVRENEDINPLEIAEILKNPQNTNTNILEKYGYNKNDLYLVGDIKQKIAINIMTNILVFGTIYAIAIIILKRKEKQKNDEINDLIYYLERINKGDYTIDLNKYSESDFSKLRNTIYKTTVLLKEHSEFLKNDRKVLKDNIADISHQLRTPLTSISLMLETILEEEEMSQAKKQEFINKIYSQNEKVNYLVELLLKLSKLDASIIEFKKDKVNANELLLKIKSSLEQLALLKNITIKITVNKDTNIICDRKWQEEALVNIIKNSIEHSRENGIIDINVEDNNFYILVTIKDNGQGIKKDNIKKIFNRFYKNENSSGFGIGLNLAKTIIEKDNGIIAVESKENEYTKFTIKYIKN